MKAHNVELSVSLTGRFISLLLAIWFFILFALSFSFGILLGSGPTEMFVNGEPKIVDEPLIGQGLLCLSLFFLIYMIMFVLPNIFVSISIDKKGSPWFYSFNFGLTGLVGALYFFIQRIGFDSFYGLLICAVMNLFAIVIASFLIYYSHSIASPFKADGTDSVLKMKTTNESQSTYYTFRFNNF